VLPTIISQSLEYLFLLPSQAAEKKAFFLGCLLSLFVVFRQEASKINGWTHTPRGERDRERKKERKKERDRERAQEKKERERERVTRVHQHTRAGRRNEKENEEEVRNATALIAYFTCHTLNGTEEKLNN
jgi:hypothetical protein